MTIVVSRLSLEDDSPVMENDQIQQLFVEYKFLGLPPQELETPFSLPKPKNSHQSLTFNFSKSKSDHSSNLFSAWAFIGIDM